MDVIKVKNLKKKFGQLKAVDDISFSVEKGEVLGFLGPNGAGKSTTMKVLTGFIAPTSGSVKILDYDLETAGLEAKKKFGYLAENAPLYGEMTPWSYLSFVASARGLGGAKGRAALMRAAQRASSAAL